MIIFQPGTSHASKYSYRFIPNYRLKIDKKNIYIYILTNSKILINLLIFFQNIIIIRIHDFRIKSSRRIDLGGRTKKQKDGISFSAKAYAEHNGLNSNGFSRQ